MINVAIHFSQKIYKLSKTKSFLREVFFRHVEDLSWKISCVNVKKTIILNFIIQKLKSKHTSLKKYTNWAMLSHVTQNLEFSCETRKWGPYTANMCRRNKIVRRWIDRKKLEILALFIFQWMSYLCNSRFDHLFRF